jgi:hypothetical protein
MQRANKLSFNHYSGENDFRCTSKQKVIPGIKVCKDFGIEQDVKKTE